MKKNGFTLVEMLAIIVLLAIIALVATPVILNIVANSQRSGFASSVNGIKDAIETDYSERNFDTSNSYKYDNGKLYFVNGKTDQIEGDPIPMSGGISDGNGVGTIDDRGNVKLRIYNSRYCGTMGIEKQAGVNVIDCNGVEACKAACGL